jgi:predicted nucleic acid-binding protein
VAEPAIIDTDVLIDAGRDIEEAIESLEQVEQQAALTICVVTQMELLVGCQNKAEQRKLVRFLRRFHIVKMNEHISDIAVALLHRYRLSHGLLIADALIAATALSQSMPFVTKNQRDYRFITGLRLLPYPYPFST